jgi:hypothetical protein
MKVALCCIAKNEDHYIKEWCEYHIKLGFDKIYIYENDWECTYNHNQIVKIPFPGQAKQVSAYNNWLNKFKHEFDFVAFFDVDEFLVLKKHESIQDFVKDYRDCSGIGINWYMFGNNGHEKVINNNYSVLERFTKRQSKMNRHIKTILNCVVNCTMNVHNPDFLNIVSPNLIIINSAFNYSYNDEIAQLNHYYCKTPEEFVKKCERGRADLIGNKRNFGNDYFIENHNEVEDLNALNFMRK